MLRLLCTIFILLSVVEAFSQNASLSTKNKKAIELYMQADNYRVRRQYREAHQLLDEAIRKDENFLEAWHRKGITYLMARDFINARKSFEKGHSLTDDPKKQKMFWYELGETLFNLGEYEQADDFLTKYLAAEPVNKKGIERAKALQKNTKFAKEASKVAAAYKQKDLPDTVNRFVLQYFPVLTADENELIFTRREGLTDQYDEDIVISRKDKNNRWTPPVSISPKINSELNEGTCTISADGRTLIFTSCAGRESIGSCDLYVSRKTGNDWSEPENLGYLVNSREWESQPSLSADGRTLYFVSDRPGNIGRRDIWMTTQDENGKWTQARNIGAPINTVYDEMSPFIHANSKALYFASNGLVGFGGYDIYWSELQPDGKWGTPKNIGAPINTQEDQFSLYITANGKKGYYAHEVNLAMGNSRSRLIETEIPESQQLQFRSNYVKGTVKDRTNKKPLAARIELVNLVKDSVEAVVYSDSLNGSYLMVLTQGAEYALYVNKKGYLFNSLNFNYSEVKDFEPIYLDVELDPVRLGSTAVLQNIFFDFDKFELKDKSLPELQKLLKFMNDNPKVRIEIGGHTDNSGSALYNKTLSEKRAQAVFQYLVDKGVASSRIVVKGYGPDKPVAGNETEEGRQRNRRIEFRLLN